LNYNLGKILHYNDTRATTETLFCSLHQLDIYGNIFLVIYTYLLICNTNINSIEYQTS